MLSVNMNYNDESGFISIRRSIKETDNFEMVIGEILYAIEVQKRGKLTAHDEFQKLSLPDEFKKNCTVLLDENEAFSLKVTICRLRDEKEKP